MINDKKTTEDDSTVQESECMSDQEAEVIETDVSGCTDEETEELSETEVLQKKCEKLSEQLQRTAAEFQNFRKRTEKHRADDRRFTTCSVIRNLLPVVDGFDAAIAASEAGQDAEQVVVGVKMVHGLLQQFFSDSKITAINPLNERFDPLKHEAVKTEATDEVEAGIILHVIQPGYSLDELVVRHARVCVSKKPDAPEVDESPETENEE
jgi:molecular chaperone GrpE